MKKRLFNLKSLIFLLGLSWLSMGAFAQTQVGNSDFEAWGGSTERPTNWNNMDNGSLCGLCGFGAIQTSWQESSILRPGTTGIYSVKVKTGKVAGQIVNGNITVGKLTAPSTTPSAGYNVTTIGDANFSEAFSGAPDSIAVWVNYSVTTSADSARISAVIHDNYAVRDPQDAGSAPYIVATAVKNFQTGGANWVRLSIPFNYTGPSSTISYILFTFASSYAPGAGVNGATLYVDDLELIYNPKVAVAPTADQNLIENQAGTLLTATETNGTATTRAWKYSTTAGGPYTNTIAGETALTYTPQFTTAGTYYVVCESTFGTYVTTSNEVKVIVSAFTNSIAPTAIQNLVPNESGNTLTVTESPTADSREWKYTTTSGSGYTSFSTAETGTTYTPNFASIGTYYVVCQSTIAGITKTSNEVQVNVTDFANSIAPTATQNLVENQTGTTLTVTETPSAADSREWKYTTTSGSGYTSFSTAQTGTTYTPQFATAGTYYVVCESTLAGNLATSNEVEIIVTVPISNIVSISPNSTQNLIENEVGTTITASETPSAADSREWKYTTTSGSGYTSFSTAETGTTYSPQFATAGTYYVVCISDFAGDIETSNEVEIVVSTFTNSIAPVATQNLIENQTGTQLTVTETPTADSREWKYTTTSGSGYTSFSTAQTGTTYTPQFATAGTYYVVCESTIAGITVISNEVEIVVSTFTNSIAPNATQNLVENQAGNMLTVTESPTADSREWKYTTTSGSGYTSFSTAQTGTTYTPQFATAGAYYVVCESTLSGMTVTSNEVEIVVTVAPANTVTIAPTTTQNLLVSTAGTQITATENPTADSREWKSSTTSGSGYTSFSPTQTGITYTPNFATAGTYYVVCMSDFGGTMATSNEVTVIVTTSAGINQNTAPSFSVYSVENGLKVDLSGTELKDATIQVVSMDGKIIAKQALTSNQVNTIDMSVPTGIYFFAISNGSQFYQGKVFMK